MFASITVIGNLGADPEIKHLPSGTIAGSFSVATNKKWTDKEGEVHNDVTWFRVVSYQTGENGLVTALIQKWLRKGQQVFVQGEPVIRKYVDQQGTERTAFEIKLGPQSTLKMMSGGNGEPKENGHDTPAGQPQVERDDPGNLGDIPI